MMRHLPNLITLGNLVCGSLGILWALNGSLSTAVYMIWLAAILDFADGLMARLVGVNSDFGKELDSLADVISFGLLPSIILYILMSEYLGPSYWPYIAFAIVVFSALRLAQFNVQGYESTDFSGLPTPANGLLISSFPAILSQNSEFLRPGLESPIFWVVLLALLSYLLISKIPLFGLKFKGFQWKGNQYRYLFLAFSLTALILLKISAVPLIVLAYLVLSVWRQYRKG